MHLNVIQDSSSYDYAVNGPSPWSMRLRHMDRSILPKLETGYPHIGEVPDGERAVHFLDQDELSAVADETIDRMIELIRFEPTGRREGYFLNKPPAFADNFDRALNEMLSW